MRLFGFEDEASTSDDNVSLLDSFKKSIGIKKEPEGFMDELKETLSTNWGLTWTQRLTGFCACFGLGLLCSFLSFMVFLHPTKFAITYSFGNLLSIGSTSFLVGPGRQLRNMCQPHRAVATLLFFLFLILTLVAALKLNNPGLALIFIICQMSAFTWYCLSYIPYARALLKRCFGGCIGEDDF